MRIELVGAILLVILFALIACSNMTGKASKDSMQKPSQKDINTSIDPQKPGNTLTQDIFTYSFEVINSWPHDPSAFTQGLVIHEGSLFESTGLNGRSSLRMVDLTSGSVLKKVDVASQYFAEGMTIFQGKIYQLTWLSQKGFIYDLETFQPEGEFSYSGQGWGLTHDEQSLIMSDGTNQIRFLDPATFEVSRTISVFNEGIPVLNLNELEFINGEIFANIWQTDMIVRIDPRDGKIRGWVDLSGLLPFEDRTRPVDVLNGIAYDRINDRILVTGKLWPKIFEIRLRIRVDQ